MNTEQSSLQQDEEGNYLLGAPTDKVEQYTQHVIGTVGTPIGDVRQSVESVPRFEDSLEIDLPKRKATYDTDGEHHHHVSAGVSGFMSNAKVAAVTHAGSNPNENQYRSRVSFVIKPNRPQPRTLAPIHQPALGRRLRRTSHCPKPIDSPNRENARTNAQDR